MSKTKIITDSGSDIPLDLIQKYNIGVVSLTVRFGKEEVIDTVKLTPEEFWTKFKSCSADSMPETAAPSPGNFVTAFETAVKEGYENIICICLSSRVSSTYESAVNALEVVKDSANIKIIDSLSVSIGEGLIVIDAAKAALNGESVDSIIDLTNHDITHNVVMGAIDNLETLKRTGRISSSTALVGSLLSIKPVVELRDGKVEQESRQRTRSKSLDYVIDKAAGVSNIKLFSILNGAAKDYESFKTKMLDKVSLGSDVNIVEADIGPIIGSHVGQGAVGFACLTD